MPNKTIPFSIDPAFEIPWSVTLVDSPASKKDQLVWDELLANPIFARTVESIRRQRNIQIGMHKRLEEAMRSRVSGRRYVRGVARKVIEYRRRLRSGDVVFVLNQFGLTPLWHGAIEHFILDGETWFPPDTRTVQPIRCLDSFGRQRLFVEIFGDTDRSGLTSRGVWKTIQHYQKNLPGYWSKWRRADETDLRKKIVVSLRRGLKPAEVCKRLVRELEPKEVTTTTAYDAWENKQAALRRLVYRVARERRVTVNVT